MDYYSDKYTVKRVEAIVFELARGVEITLYKKDNTGYVKVSYWSGNNIESKAKFQHLKPALDFVVRKAPGGNVPKANQIKRSIANMFAGYEETESVYEFVTVHNLKYSEGIYEKEEEKYRTTSTDIDSKQLVRLFGQVDKALDGLVESFDFMDARSFTKKCQDMFRIIREKVDILQKKVRSSVQILNRLIYAYDQTDVLKRLINHPTAPHYDTERINLFRAELGKISEECKTVTEPPSVVMKAQDFFIRDVESLLYRLAPDNFPYPDNPHEFYYNLFDWFCRSLPREEAQETLRECELIKIIQYENVGKEARRAVFEAYFLDQQLLTREQIREAFELAEQDNLGPRRQEIIREWDLDVPVHKENKTIYADGQNVHASSVANTVKDSIRRLSQKHPNPMTIGQCFLDMIPNVSEKVLSLLLSYSEDTTQISDLSMTFGQVLCLVCTEIRALNDADIYKILSDEVIDGEGRCFTRKFSSILSSLAAISQEVSVTISESEQIGAIMANIRNKVESKIMSLEQGKAEATERLTELGISKEEQNKWVPYL